MKWLRVNRNQLCAICERKDWCGYSSDGNYAICMRIESDRASTNGGWLHRLSDPIPYMPRPPKRIEPLVDLNGLWGAWIGRTDFHHVDGFAMSLGVDTAALQAVGCAWNGEAWAFPMRDAQKRLIGLRLRNLEGRKWAVSGSKQGLFIPSSYPYCIDDGTIYLTEGPTDLAAAMTIGLYAIARPSCLGQEDMIIAYLQGKARRVVIVTDNDTPGLSGAHKLQNRLSAKSCIFTPPAKDLREYTQFGGTANMIESSLRDLTWKRAA